ncbi:MAG: DUF1015 domain-containing protein [Thermoanaerobacterales bacterium]|nr:DUF1015 domain-containing protein [Thermoanaerobacterales bacterium]
MATIVPLCGLRYNPELIPGLAAVVTPPYDVIGPEAQERYYDRSPHNIIRLEYGKTFPGDNEDNNRYTRARDTLAAWQQEGVLLREHRPAIYLYEQEFTVAGRVYRRRGFFCGVALTPFSEGQVLPHEETLPKAKEDRLNLLRACRANFSPVFGLYTDESMATDRILREAAAAEPDTVFTDEEGHVHRLWVISAPEPINRLVSALRPRRIYIADGHHRYETALAYAQEHPEPGLHHNVLMVLVNLYDPGLVILPTHRLARAVRTCPSPDLLAALAPLFTVESFAGKPAEFFRRLRELGRHSFGLYAGAGNLYYLTLRPGADLRALMPAGRSPAWQQLDVAILHHLILEPHLGIGAGERARQGGPITYTREEEQALARVDRGEYTHAFFLNPTSVQEMVDVAEAGDRMPQKSTYFYPKLITGLVINAF